MTTEQATELLKRVMADEALAERLREMSMEEIVDFVKGQGFDVTAEALNTALDSLRKKASGEILELNTDEMDKVAGGWLGYGDDAKDGHEMGCILSWHGLEWSIEHLEWCRYEYYYGRNARISKGEIIRKNTHLDKD